MPGLGPRSASDRSSARSTTTRATCPGRYPLLTLDMWEHAFYLRYRNVTADDGTSWWTVVTWADVIDRVTRVRGVRL